MTLTFGAVFDLQVAFKVAVAGALDATPSTAHSRQEASRSAAVTIGIVDRASLTFEEVMD